MKKIFGAILSCAVSLFFVGTPALAAEAPASFKKCQACHKVDEDHTAWKVGPGLKGIGKRVSAGYLEKALKDPQGTFDAGGAEIETLKKGAKFKTPLKMPKAVEKLTDAEIKELAAYMMTL